MNNPMWGASYELGTELMEAGCPIDYRDALPRNSAALHQSFRVEQIIGYGDSRIYRLGRFHTGWVILLRLRTDRPSGTIIGGWSFKQPWQNHDIIWDYEPADIIPKKHQEDYKQFFKSPVMKVFNEGHLIRRGYPVEGILCGESLQPIGESSNGFVSAELSLTDDAGNTVGLGVNLTIWTLGYSGHIQLPSREVRHRFFRNIDPQGRLAPTAIPTCPGSESVSLPCDLKVGVRDLL